MMGWAIKEEERKFWLEANFLTGWGVDRELQRSRFVRSPEAIYGFKSYIRYWPDGIYAVEVEWRGGRVGGMMHQGPRPTRFLSLGAVLHSNWHLFLNQPSNQERLRSSSRPQKGRAGGR